MSAEIASAMSSARDLINAHLYPVLATFSVIYFAIQVAPMAQQARRFNRCVDGIEAHLKASNIPLEYRLATWPSPSAFAMAASTIELML